MNRVLVILLLLTACFASCKKGYDALEEVRIQADKDDKIIQDYIAANPAIGDVKQVDSAGVATGIYYVVLAPGEGSTIYTNSTSITIDFTARILTTGEVFFKSNNFHPSYTLGAVLRAWKLAIPQIKKGGKIRILSPSRYAYGPYDQPEIGLPKNSVVDFEIELLDVTN
ncbi:FKBP-type peptidyl-prolyl cis-trans isomerase [Mucilaginibacter litoreus]|uniref:Peptidyl-prolyl cis-trans isomerase n=1 Tax=Mucilaginibacter litoreus TaxID=1048221 RepID=A0ABW3ARQ8_9SPHI